ncbi:hypothetical protein [Streptomyces huiliensis]|uniref:hypothetical protein n=1 Tax=Streptomyces huiliensis TaxID=2876027 RepID=UPI001CBF1310|nr:hypothetical protein [Streptomyces huiliensis]MBZ4319460.1 hypothetical protein [Streptomyces huiliensis]
MTDPAPLQVKGYDFTPDPLEVGKDGTIEIAFQPTKAYDADKGVTICIEFPVGSGAGDLATADGARNTNPSSTNQHAWDVPSEMTVDQTTATLTCSRSGNWADEERIVLENTTINAAVGTSRITVYRNATNPVILDGPRNVSKGDQAFTFTRLRPDPITVEPDKSTRLVWQLTKPKTAQADYTFEYAGVSTPYGKKSHPKYEAHSWTSQPLNDQAVVFAVTATVNKVQHCQWAQVHVRRGRARTGPLTARGTIGLLAARSQHLLDEVALTGTGDEKKADGLVDGHQQTLSGKEFDAFFSAWTRTAATDGLLIVRCTTRESAGRGKMRLPVTVSGGHRVKTWLITTGTALTLPLATGTGVALGAPVYDGGQRHLTLHWVPFGGYRPLGQ